MAQSTMHTCTKCNAAVPNTMSFCPNCGTPTNTGYAPTQKAVPPYPNYPAQASQGYQPTPNQQYQPPLQGAQPPVYAQPQKGSGRGILKVGMILLLLLILIGAGGFFAFRYMSGKVGNIVSSGTISAVTPTQAPLKTTPINTTVNYASVNITIINAQQATSFADDRDMPAQGVVRLNLHSVQSDANNVYFTSAPKFAYPESFTLLLPGGAKVSTGGYKELTGPARTEEQTTWLDFPAPTSLKVDQMILQIGKDTEEQMQVPLTGTANLSQYQPKQSTPNLRVQFGSLFWTLKAVTFKLSDSGTQADKGQRFLVLAFSIDNPSSEGDNSYPGDYIRLQYAGTVIPCDQAMIGGIAANTTNTQGLVSFLVPQDTTTATFILLPGHTLGATSQATIPVQVP